MRKRVFNWQGQGFVYLGLEGQPGKPVDQQAKGLFDRAATELKTFGLAIDKNLVRSMLLRQGGVKKGRNHTKSWSNQVRCQSSGGRPDMRGEPLGS